jgi:hypothetical protein
MTTAKEIGHGTFAHGTTGGERYTTYGAVRGMGPIRTERRVAERDMKSDQDGCAKQGGYSDRDVYEIDSEGFLRTIGNRMLVWPSSGRSNGAVRLRSDDTVRG